MNIFDTGLIFTPEYLFHEKKYGSWGDRELRAEGSEFWYTVINQFIVV